MKTAPFYLDATPTMMEIMPVDDGDHVHALVMKIEGAKTKGPYHIAYESHVMLILYASYFA